MLSTMLSRTPLQTMATIKPISQSEHLTGQEFWSKNKALKRPISPHLTIYKFQLTSMLSITHRGTGLAQSGMLTGAGLGALMLPGNHSAHYTYLTMSIQATSPCSSLILLPCTLVEPSSLPPSLSWLGQSCSICGMDSGGFVLSAFSLLSSFLYLQASCLGHGPWL